jgi:hypothetical protein
MKAFLQYVYEICRKQPQFEWGTRPAELIGKTSMKAVWNEYEEYDYYGETL